MAWQVPSSHRWYSSSHRVISWRKCSKHIIPSRCKKSKEVRRRELLCKIWNKVRCKGRKNDMIKKIVIRFTCYIIASKTMRHFTRNECTLDAIFVAEHCCKGEVFNWFSFILNKLFEACEDIYRWNTNFLFGYILMSLVMWKSKPLRGDWDDAGHWRTIVSTLAWVMESFEGSE